MEQSDRDGVVERAIAAHRHLPGALLPILHAISHELGHVPRESVPAIAAALNLTRAEVTGVITFYHDFRSEPPGRTIVKLCRAEACQAMGADALAAHVAKKLGIEFHETRKDGAVTLEPIYCLGNCACAPAITIDGRMYGRVDARRFDELLGSVK
jgi:formate dehydrogenase subunit gamma